MPFWHFSRGPYEEHLDKIILILAAVHEEMLFKAFSFFHLRLPFCSVEQNRLGNTSRGPYEEYLGKLI